MTRRQQLLNSITSRLQPLVANPVIPWKKNIGTLPAITWRDGVSQEIDGLIGGAHPVYEMTLEVIAYLQAGNTTSQARSWLADIWPVLTSDISQGGLADSTEGIRIELRQLQAGDIITAGMAVIKIVFTAPPVEDPAGETNYLIDEESGRLTDENGDTLTW